jgi:hypothetical protein
MARVNLTGDVLGDDEEAALPAAERRPSEPTASAAPAQRTPKPIRTTVDLPPGRHAALQRWCLDAAPQVGRPRVHGQQVMRALVARLLTDERLSRQIIADLADNPTSS